MGLILELLFDGGDRVINVIRSVIWAIIAVLVAPASASAQQIADSFQFPVANYQPKDGCLEWRGTNPNFPGKLHAGDDFCAPAGTDVVAAGNGIVRYAGPYKPCTERGNWGYLIVIEHTMQDRSLKNSIYGHIAPTPDIRSGVTVRRGQRIGDVVHMPCWSDHIHFGIYDGPYRNISCSYNPATNQGNCNTAGYIAERLFPAGYRDPVAFVHDNPPPPPYVLKLDNGNNPHTCGDLPTHDVDWYYTCTDERDVFDEGQTVWGLFRIDTVRLSHAFLAQLCQGDYCADQKQWFNLVPSGEVWRWAFNWPEFRNVAPGDWEIRFYVDTGSGFSTKPQAVTSFTMRGLVHVAGDPGEGEPPPPPPPPPPPDDHPPYLYDGNTATCLGPVTGGEATGWIYTCENPTNQFNQDQNAWYLVRADEVYVPYRFKSDTYWFDPYHSEWDYMWSWTDEQYTPDPVWGSRHVSFSGYIEHPPPGDWQERIFWDIGNGFQELTRIPQFTSVLTAPPYEDRGIYQMCYGPIQEANAANNWRASCQNLHMSGIFNAGDTIYAMVEIDNVWVRHRMRITITHNDNTWDPWVGDWQHTDTPWMWAAIFPYTHIDAAEPGTWTFTFEIDPGDGFRWVNSLTFLVQ